MSDEKSKTLPQVGGRIEPDKYDETVIQAAIDRKLYWYEKGLDTAGETGAALAFEHHRDDLSQGRISPAEMIYQIVMDYNEHNGNKDLAIDFIKELLQVWAETQDILEDVVNQACTHTYTKATPGDSRHYLTDMALSAYESALDFLLYWARVGKVDDRDIYFWLQFNRSEDGKAES